VHEASLARSLLRQVQQLAARQPEARVVRVNVLLGEFCGVEPELLAAAFADLAAASPLGAVNLVIQHVSLAAKCEECGEDFAVERFRFVCPACQCRRARVTRGEELLLESVTFQAEAA
jgi:hydrogenase nickel incorporation protein HypA/HybF